MSARLLRDTAEQIRRDHQHIVGRVSNTMRAVADLLSEAADEWDEYRWPLDRPLVEAAVTLASTYAEGKP